MSEFVMQAAMMMCEKVSLMEIAEAVGTPVFV